ncbi:MAG: hypothetical protein M0P19_11430 [Nevskia sp.]|nr:hypothetical protein [Nevskia sp.]MCK9385291.1 hypothetical protein [Nevskia sp.]
MNAAADIRRANTPSSPLLRAPFLAGACLAARRWEPQITEERLGLSESAAQGLADVLPVLICGEASAELVFRAVESELPDDFDPDLAAALNSIADDEHRHGIWLDTVRAQLPSPSSRSTARHAARFLRQLACQDLGLHLTRVAALDAGVCMILAEVCARQTPIAASPPLLSLFTRIRRDEGRHVRISRRGAAALGADPSAQADERKRVLAALAALLVPQGPSLAAIGVDINRLQRRFELTGARR